MTGTPGAAERIRALFRAHLAARGLRMTRPRERILEHLLRSRRHQSLDEIHRALKAHGVGRATVFRTLRMLEECRLLGRLTGTGKAARFEMGAERPHHDHLLCVDCGRIVEVSWPGLEELQARGCRRLGFEPLWHRHEVFGRCASCSKGRSRHG
ncbi:MAG: Fur family transcriptional regulator [Elusimicrobiota bacterium]|jgi:Fur family ferric uptake transcriptional regulator